MRRFVLIFATALLAICTEASPLLDRAAAKWLEERDNWAFTMHVREYEGDTLKEERQERYDPSKAGLGRWALLSVDGRQPAPERLAQWQKHKMKRGRSTTKPLSDYFDFDRASIVDHTDTSIRYRVPLHSTSELLFPLERVGLKVTINRATAAMEKIEAGIDEPYNVALGLGRVMDVALDVNLNPDLRVASASDPAAAKPDGTAHFALNRLGKRIEYDFSDFQRVTPTPDNVHRVVRRST